jgi:GT2 family glycosyltransferase
MALCAIKKMVLTQIGGFDEYYYNSHEGLELTLKISLSGYSCFYCANAIAYHCTGGARDKTLYDTSKQKAHFYQKWDKKIQYDVSEYLALQLQPEYNNTSYFILNFSGMIYLKEFILKNCSIKYFKNVFYQISICFIAFHFHP